MPVGPTLTGPNAYQLEIHPSKRSALLCQRTPSPVDDLVGRESKRTKYSLFNRNMDSFPSFYTRMVGIEAMVLVCTKKTIRCCTAYFRGHGESLRGFCTRECRKRKSRVKETVHAIICRHYDTKSMRQNDVAERGEKTSPVLLT